MFIIAYAFKGQVHAFAERVNCKSLILQDKSNIEIFLSPVMYIDVYIFQEDELKKAVLVVYANKQDIEGAMTVSEVANALGLTNIKTQKYQIFKTSAIKGTGLDEAMEW